MPPSRYLPKTTYRTKRTGKHRALIIISPKYLSTVKGGCPHYRSSTKVRYAQGFIGILENLPYKQMQTVILHLMNYLGRRTYYRARKGERFSLLPNNSNTEYPQKLRSYHHTRI